MPVLNIYIDQTPTKITQIPQMQVTKEIYGTEKQDIHIMHRV